MDPKYSKRRDHIINQSQAWITLIDCKSQCFFSSPTFALFKYIHKGEFLQLSPSANWDLGANIRFSGIFPILYTH